jgi:hypothetical protein
MRNREESFASGEPETSRSVVKGALAGMAGGLVASWVMSRLQNVMESSGGEDAVAANPALPPIAEEQLASTTYSSSAPGLGTKTGPDATRQVRPELRMANRISKTFLKHEIPAERENVAGQCTHYAFGTLVGGLYGAVAEMRPEVVSKLGGMPFGMAVWLLAEELALPALHLTDGPQDVPLKKHATGLASHFAYGATTDGVRRLLRKTVIH